MTDKLIMRQPEPDMPPTPPPAVETCHQLLAWLIPQLDRFPRLRRHTLGVQIETRLLDVLACLVEAGPACQSGGAYGHRQRA